MIFTGVGCDSCDKYLKFPLQGDPKKQKLPDHWLSLYKGDYQQNDPWHFCCYRCLGDWIFKEGKNTIGVGGIAEMLFAKGRAKEEGEQERKKTAEFRPISSFDGSTIPGED